jgi:hypothetical protein
MCYKRSGMVSNLLKRWRDDFATVKRQRDGFRAFRKETGCHPASSRPTSSTGRFPTFSMFSRNVDSHVYKTKRRHNLEGYKPHYHRLGNL